jgi:hypothetical protein
VFAIVLVTGTVLGLAYAGSPERLPAGSQIAGVDVSGLTTSEARSLLERRSRELGRTPVVFTAEGRRWRVKPDSVLVDVDWGAAVEAAHQQGEGFGPLRGLKRLGVRVFGGEVVPTTRVYDAAVRSYVARPGSSRLCGSRGSTRKSSPAETAACSTARRLSKCSSVR